MRKENFIKVIALRFEKFDHRLLFVGLFFFVIVLGYLDYLSGFEYAFSLFYLIPIAMAAWFISRPGALVLSVFSAISWSVSNSLAGQTYSQVFISYWNTFIRLGFFIIVSLLFFSMKKAMEREKELSSTDMNTGLMNSRAFFQQATAELLRAKRYKRPFTLAYIDIDNFKQINDQLGHLSGDMVLKSVADTMRTRLRNTDLIARIGGDEFVALLPETEYTSGSVVISKLQAYLLKAMERHHWDVTFSMGVVTYYKHAASFNEVLQQADKLMYTAKQDGKNAIRFDTVE
jgi:diguanylate cyclase (GGDEF)-like protein